MACPAMRTLSTMGPGIALLIVGGLGAAASGAGPQGTEELALRLRVRDGLTGLGVQHVEVSVEQPGAPPRARHVKSEGPIVALALEAPDVRLVVGAEGYRTLTLPPPQVAAMAEAAAPRRRWVSTVWLAPRMPPADLGAERVAERAAPGAAFLHGHVVDSETLLPVPGAEVRLQRAGIETRTNERGYFWLNAPGARSEVTLKTPPETDTLVIAIEGYALYRLTDIPLLATDTHYVVDLEKGEGEAGRPAGHRLLRWNEPPPEPEVEGEDQGTDEAESADRKRLVLEPVATIDVEGYGVMSLETYVANGLDNEWFSWWSADALRAGAVAYRTYGSWHQIHNGGICATTTCQAYDPDSSVGSRRAAEETAGVLLARGGKVVKAEYSSETNARRCEGVGCANSDLSCGDGAAGSPDARWPCLDDDHGFDSWPGRCCFGHGRGMCQHGTEDWSKRGWSWPRIVNHYYNDHGAGSPLRRAFMTSPLSVSLDSMTPSEVSAGGRFEVVLEGSNLAEYRHRHLLVRMRLAGGSGGVADETGDHPIELPEGEDTPLLLPFSVPAQTSPGAYGLAATLWLDADGDGAVGAHDLEMSEAHAAGLVTVREGAAPRLLRLTQPYMRGEDVRDVQRALNTRGYALALDGTFGPLTDTAVRAFQGAEGLVVDGIVGPVTRTRLGL